MQRRCGARQARCVEKPVAGVAWPFRASTDAFELRSVTRGLRSRSASGGGGHDVRRPSGWLTSPVGKRRRPVRHSLEQARERIDIGSRAEPVRVKTVRWPCRRTIPMAATALVGRSRGTYAMPKSTRYASQVPDKQHILCLTSRGTSPLACAAVERAATLTHDRRGPRRIERGRSGAPQWRSSPSTSSMSR